MSYHATSVTHAFKLQAQIYFYEVIGGGFTARVLLSPNQPVYDEVPSINQHYGVWRGTLLPSPYKSMREYISRAAVIQPRYGKGTTAKERGQHGQTSRTPGHPSRHLYWRLICSASATISRDEPSYYCNATTNWPHTRNARSTTWTPMKWSVSLCDIRRPKSWLPIFNRKGR